MADKIIKWNDRILTFNNKIISKGIIAPPPPTYPTLGLVERWDFATLTGLNGITWSKVTGTDNLQSGGPGSFGCIYFDKSTYYICASASIATAIKSNHAFSISMWINSVSGDNTYIGVMGDPCGDQGTYFPVMISYNSPKLLWSIWDTGTGDFHFTADDVFGLSSWVHFVGTYDGTNLAGYVNAVSSISPVACTRSIDSGGLGIGHDSFSSPGTFKGKLALMYLYDRVLSQSDVTELYNNGNGA